MAATFKGDLTLPNHFINQGDFDQFTGATITPRAVVHAVHMCLVYFDRHKEELIQQHAKQDKIKATEINVESHKTES